MAWYGIAWLDIAWYGIEWYGVAWYTVLITGDRVGVDFLNGQYKYA